MNLSTISLEKYLPTYIEQTKTRLTLKTIFLLVNYM